MVATDSRGRTNGAEPRHDEKSDISNGIYGEFVGMRCIPEYGGEVVAYAEFYRHL